MSNPKRSLSQEQKIFEIEERVYRLLAPELRSKYTLYRKVPTYPREQRHLKMQYLNYSDTLPLAISKHMLLRTGT